MAKQSSVTPIKSTSQHLLATDINRLHLRNGYYYLRTRVPSDIRTALPQPYTGKREIKISLKTRDKGQALSLFCLHASTVDQIFATTRLRLLTGVQLQSHTQQIATQAPGQTAPAAVQGTSASAPSQVTTFGNLVGLRVEQMRIDRRAEKSIEEFQGKMKVFSRLFKARLGSRFKEDLNTIQYDDIAAVLSRLQNYKRKGRTIGPRTAYAYGIALASLFKFGVQQRYLSHSCMPKLVKPKEMKRSASGDAAGWKALGEQEMRKLLTTLHDQKEIDSKAKCKGRNTSGSQDPMALRTMLALYTGLRIEEICSLRCQDIQTHDDVLCVSVNALHGKHVKSTSSLRIVPLHRSISEQVLAHKSEMLNSYTDTPAADQLLWPDVKPYRGKYSAAFSKQFGRFLRKYVSKDKMHVFHSLRKNFAQSLQNEGVQRELIGELLGHCDPTVTSLYTGGYNIQGKTEAIQKLKF